MAELNEEKLESLKRELEDLKSKGFEKEVEEINAKLLDPSRITEVELDIKALRQKRREKLFEFQIAKEIDKAEARHKPRIDAAAQKQLMIDEIFVIYKGGLLLSHQTRRLKPYADKDIVAGMLTAVMSYIQDFGKDTFRQKSECVRKIEYANYKILIETGEYVCIAVVLSGEEPPNTTLLMRESIEKIENKYSEYFKNWDGTLQKIKEIDGFVTELVNEIASSEVVPVHVEREKH